MGLLVFRQGEEYGVIDFKRINDYELEIEYWIGDPDVTDFSDASLELGRQDAVISVPNIVSKTQFSNSYLGYEFTFPSRWNLDEWSDSNLNTYYNGNIDTQRGSSMNISIKAIPRNGFTLEQHIDDELSGDREDFIENSRKSLNSVKGILLLGFSPQWSIPHIREKMVFVTDNYRVVIMFMADNAVFTGGDENKSNWEDFVNSVKQISSTTGISVAQKQEIEMLKNELENRKSLLEKDRVSGKAQNALSWEKNMETEKANWEKERIEFKESWDLAIQQLNEDFESELKDFLDSSNQEIENFENQINDMKEIQFNEQTNLISRWDSEIVARQNRIRRNVR